LKELAHSLGIADRVLFPGWIGPKEKEAWFKQAACLALPSYAEGLPMAVLEAMARKVPVVASAVGGIPGVVQPGITGWLITPGDVDALAAHLGRVLQDVAHRRSLGDASRQLVEQDYAADSVVARLGQLYHDLGVSPPGH
jgi:glycosyltransferase involved in cell wall biosynthesis